MKWLKESNRYKHLIGGFILGVISTSWWMALCMGASVGMALEFKDKAHGGKWDWLDTLVTWVGAILGYLVRIGIVKILF